MDCQVWYDLGQGQQTGTHTALMSGQRPHRWPNKKPTLGQRFTFFAGSPSITPMSAAHGF